MLDAGGLARAVFDAISREDERSLAQLIHPEAELEMAMAPGLLIRGRAEVLEVLRQAWGRIHTLSIDTLHTLSDTAVIIEGRSRHPIGDRGFSDSEVVWLCIYHDDMLFRQRIFTNVATALVAWESQGASGEEPARRGTDHA